MRRLSGMGVALGMALIAPALFAQSPSVNDGFDPNTTGVVNAISGAAERPDHHRGQLYPRRSPDGATAPTTINRIARLKHQRDARTPLSSPNVNGQIFAMALQPNGQDLLVGGSFTRRAAQWCRGADGPQ